MFVRLYKASRSKLPREWYRVYDHGVRGQNHAVFKVCNAHSPSRWCDQHDLFRVSCPAKIYAITVEDVHGHQEVSNLGPSWKLAESATSASRIILCKA
jgi:hypothetical protein